MPDLYDGDRVVDAAEGDDRGIWFEDVVSIHGDIRTIFKEREISYLHRRINHIDAGNAEWHYHPTGYYLYCVANSDYTCFPVSLPVGSIINELEISVTGSAGQLSGDMQFKEYRVGGTVVTSIDIETVANPWDTGGTAPANMTTYTQTTAHASLPMTIKSLHYYYFRVVAANNAGAGENRIYNLKLKYEKVDH